MAEFPEFLPGTYEEFKLFRKCEKGKTGEDEEGGDTPARATYRPALDHILRQCATCGYLWWETPKGD